MGTRWLLALAAVAVATWQPGGSLNLLRNPSFEEDVAGGLDWRSIGFVTSRTQGDAWHGNFSLHCKDR